MNMKKSSVLLLILLAGLLAAPAFAQDGTAALGAAGEVYLAKVGAYKDLFPKDHATTPGNTVLAVDLIQDQVTSFARVLELGELLLHLLQLGGQRLLFLAVATLGLPAQLEDLDLEPVDLIAGAVQLLLQGDDPLDPGQAHALVGQLLDPLEAVDVAVGVAAGPAHRPLRLDQALPLVDPQGLGVHPGQFGTHDEDVARARQALDRALALDPDLGLAHAVKGEIAGIRATSASPAKRGEAV